MVVVHVLRSRQQVAPRSLAHQVAETVFPTLSAQVETDEGYGIFSSWDDGNGGTWEGNVYTVDYHENLDTSVDSQIDISQYQPPR